MITCHLANPDEMRIVEMNFLKIVQSTEISPMNERASLKRKFGTHVLKRKLNTNSSYQKKSNFNGTFKLKVLYIVPSVTSRLVVTFRITFLSSLSRH